MTSFADLGVPADMLDALEARNMTEAFDIQAATIPEALAGRDVSGRAPTGSGKTLAFGIPLVANVQRAKPKRPRGLILVPTRELAAQVTRDLSWLGMERGIRVHSFYGGVGFDAQLKALRSGVDIAVACPGRLADLVNQNRMRLDGVDHVVIDEADRMADMGFLPEVRRILDQTASERQTLLFSATLDGDVDVLVKNYQTNPIRHEVVADEDAIHRVAHHFWSVDASKRVEICADIIEHTGQTIVFTRTRHGADRLSRQLDKIGISTVAIHGDRSQRQRDRALADFTSGRARAMIATDVAARGIHVDAVACVIHHDLPADEKDYVHRSGRTGRAEAEGIVIALVTSDKRKDANKILRKLKLDVTTVDPDLALLGEPTVVAPPRRPHTPSESRGTGGPRAKRSQGDRPRRESTGDRFNNRNDRPARSERSEGRPTRDGHIDRRPVRDERSDGRPTRGERSDSRPARGERSDSRPTTRSGETRSGRPAARSNDRPRSSGGGAPQSRKERRLEKFGAPYSRPEDEGRRSEEKPVRDDRPYSGAKPARSGRPPRPGARAGAPSSSAGHRPSGRPGRPPAPKRGSR